MICSWAVVIWGSHARPALLQDTDLEDGHHVMHAHRGHMQAWPALLSARSAQKASIQQSLVPPLVLSALISQQRSLQ